MLEDAARQQGTLHGLPLQFLAWSPGLQLGSNPGIPGWGCARQVREEWDCTPKEL